MSKNLSEPGINKSAAANEWNTRQLLRRPAPPSGDSQFTWARRKRCTTTQTIAGNSSQVKLTFQTACDYNDYPTDFTLVTIAGADSGIKCINAGVYTLNCRVFCNSLATEFTINFWGVDPDSWGPYGISVSTLQVSTELSGYASLTTRLRANAEIFATIRQNSGLNKTIDAGTYLEAIKHPGTATVTGMLADS